MTSSKICFVSLMNLHALPYLTKYAALINESFDIIYWNRYNMSETCGAQRHYAMNYEISRTNRVQKLIGYMKFRGFAREILEKNRYEKIILLSGNVAVLLRKVLLRYYTGKYIIDIRDYFLENNKYYYETEKKLIESSALAVISSEGYKSFLPEHEYLIVHNSPNLAEDMLCQFKREHEQWLKSKDKDSPIVLSFIGGVRFLDQDRNVLRYFADDDRFFVRYIGAGADQLQSFCEEIGMKNVYIHDRFAPEETLDFYKETDMVLNLYGNGTPLLDYALSNKLYYAAALGLPILVCPKTYMEQVSVESGFGFKVDINDNTSRERLYESYRTIDWQRFYQNCNRFMGHVHLEDELFKISVDRFLNR